MANQEKLQVISVEYLNEGDVDARELLITLSNGTEIHACACYESWEQWGGTQDELYVSMPIVEQNNAWLHGWEDDF